MKHSEVEPKTTIEAFYNLRHALKIFWNSVIECFIFDDEPDEYPLAVPDDET